jgi:hypothetical protein
VILVIGKLEGNPRYLFTVSTQETRGRIKKSVPGSKAKLVIGVDTINGRAMFAIFGSGFRSRREPPSRSRNPGFMIMGMFLATVDKTVYCNVRKKVMITVSCVVASR